MKYVHIFTILAQNRGVSFITTVDGPSPIFSSRCISSKSDTCSANKQRLVYFLVLAEFGVVWTTVGTSPDEISGLGFLCANCSDSSSQIVTPDLKCGAFWFVLGLFGLMGIFFFPVDSFGFQFIFFLENNPEFVIFLEHNPDPGLLFLGRRIFFFFKVKQHLLAFYLMVPIVLVQSVAGLNGR